MNRRPSDYESLALPLSYAGTDKDYTRFQGFRQWGKVEKREERQIKLFAICGQFAFSDRIISSAIRRNYCPKSMISWKKQRPKGVDMEFFTTKLTAKLTGVSLRQLQYWDETKKVRHPHITPNPDASGWAYTGSSG